MTICSSGNLAIAKSADPFHITTHEKAACASDAARLCAQTYPDENQLLGCMKVNRAALGAACKVAFDTGLRRRHLE